MIIGISGHGPIHLPCKYNKSHDFYLSCINKLKEYLSSHKANLIISGMALGWDQWVVEECIKLSIPFSAYIPFPSQYIQWPNFAQKKYIQLLKKAQKIVTISKDPYSVEKMIKRNVAVVDASDIMLVLWNPKIRHGGTFQCVHYAEEKGKKVVNLWEAQKKY